ncbi:methylmalonyl-CoA mutase subunit beta [Lutibacter sp.]|uniref:methylmalonyl-CoA mutase subunit beta n=1 Tax=Lutibacter sp. TaxID=1925666 RepID=UPI0025BDF9AE|nr:methylmalonyl-CoA mutase subunit beta [Lutibacter sp.]MCF6182037.1 methylmalonyl-CoA mutase subunit beta [Lutibacter sp.]
MALSFLNNFKPITAAEWKQKIQVDLKGADYNKTLLTSTLEGITIKPFYHLDTFKKLKIPTPTTDFKICQNILIHSEEEANKIATNALLKGANALKFIVDKPFNFENIFENLLNKNYEFHFQFNFLDQLFLLELSEFLKNEIFYLNIDPIGQLTETGNWFYNFKEDFKILAQLSTKIKKHHLVGINSKLYQNAGANTVQQIAYSLAHANEYLTQFGGEIVNQIQFNIAIGNNYFFEIAKIRAIRYLYNLISNTYNKNTIAQVFAQPSFRNKTIYDYNVNMLRTTTECMSGILGGTNTIANISYDNVFHYPNEFGERIARNQLLILKEESYFKNAQNIATNSYYIEEITNQLVEKSLTIFKEIEKSGGFLKQLKEGTIQRKIKENAQKEQQLFNENKLILVGTNSFKQENESLKNNLEKHPFTKKNYKKTSIIPIIPKRLAEEVEQIRLKNEA